MKPIQKGPPLKIDFRADRTHESNPSELLGINFYVKMKKQGKPVKHMDVNCRWNSNDHAIQDIVGFYLSL